MNSQRCNVSIGMHVDGQPVYSTSVSCSNRQQRWNRCTTFNGLDTILDSI